MMTINNISSNLDKSVLDKNVPLLLPSMIRLDRGGGSKLFVRLDQGIGLGKFNRVAGIRPETEYWTIGIGGQESQSNDSK